MSRAQQGSRSRAPMLCPHHFLLMGPWMWGLNELIYVKPLEIWGLHRWFTNLPPSAVGCTYNLLLSTCHRNSCCCWQQMLVDFESLKDPPPSGLWGQDTGDSVAHIHCQTSVQDHWISKSHWVKAWRQENYNSSNSHLWYGRGFRRQDGIPHPYLQYRHGSCLWAPGNNVFVTKAIPVANIQGNVILLGSMRGFFHPSSWTVN